jgi:thiol-disulfide isomerase/thioredoxin
VPEALPDLQMPNLSGRQVSLHSFLGHPLIINFWATWCAPCRREIPLLLQLRRRHQAEGLEVVGIAVDFRESVAAYLKRTPIDYPLLIGEQQGLDAAAQFGMEPVLPFSVFVDAHGQVVAVKIGELHAPEADYLVDTLHNIDHGQMTLTEARERIAKRLQQLSLERAGVASGKL